MPVIGYKENKDDDDDFRGTNCLYSVKNMDVTPINKIENGNSSMI
jgi:hypothetical protein